MSDRFTKVGALEPHPERGLVPDLSPEEFDALKDDIREKGIMQPILAHEGRIIDGHHRWRAAKELGLSEVTVIGLIGMSADEEVERMIALNGNRRQWSREQKRETAVKLRERGWTYDKIRTALGVGQGTAYEWTAHVSSSEMNNSATPPTVTGKDGKHYPARKPRKGPLAKVRENGAPARPGARLAIPDDKTPEDVVREYAPVRADGAGATEVAREAGINARSFSLMEKVVALADRSDLSDKDAAVAKGALQEMNETRQVASVSGRILPLFERVYGSGKSADFAKREAVLAEAFDRAFGSLIQACSMAPEIKVPYMTKERSEAVLAELSGAVQSVKSLIKKVEVASP